MSPRRADAVSRASARRGKRAGSYPGPDRTRTSQSCRHSSRPARHQWGIVRDSSFVLLLQAARRADAPFAERVFKQEGFRTHARRGRNGTSACGNALRVRGKKSSALRGCAAVRAHVVEPCKRRHAVPALLAQAGERLVGALLRLSGGDARIEMPLEQRREILAQFGLEEADEADRFRRGGGM